MDQLRSHIDLRFLEVAGRFDTQTRAALAVAEANTLSIKSIDDRLFQIQESQRDHQRSHDDAPTKSQTTGIAGVVAVVFTLLTDIFSRRVA